MEEKTLSGCHDHALVLASVLRKYGFPAVMVDTAGIQWSLEYSEGKRDDFAGHVFVEVYSGDNWVLLNPTSGEYVENYDPHDPIITMKNPDEDRGFYVLSKGVDPEGYGITSIEQLEAHMEAFAEMVISGEIRFPSN